MFSNPGLMAGREPTSAVIVAMRNDLVRGGVERMLQALGVTEVHPRRDLGVPAESVSIGGGILVALVSEIDAAVAPELRAAEESGTRVLLLLSGNGDVAELSRIRALGIRGAGFLTVDGLGQADLYDALSRMDNGEVPIPAGLARNLLALAEQNPVATSSRPRLTPRESEVLGLMVEGMSNKQIARRLRVSDHGAKRHVANILAKLDVANRTLAVAKALREGLYERATELDEQ
jgi:DNA-binding NarL/FixJ family response regulator